MPGFYVLNLGCKVNRAESDTMAASCIAAGAERTSPEDADVAIVNTCTVTAEAEAKTRKAVRRLCRMCSCPVIVTGCAAAVDGAELAALGERVVVEPARLRASQMAVGLLRDAGADTDRPGAGDAFAMSSPEAAAIRASGGFKTRMDIKIQDGCPNACTFCIVHTARGPAVSVDASEVVAQVASAAEAGVGEVVLAGINIGCYESGGLRLPGLLDELMGTDIGRVRISSIEPPHVDAELADVMARHGDRICAHLHVPLQSGCARTLAAMGRLYDPAEFESRVALVRQARPELSLTTDVIVGFPGESESDFEESLGFCRRMGFSKMHVFRYSRRAGTPAAELDGQVPPDVMSERAARMRGLSDQMRLEDALSRVGSGERLLMMSPTIGMAQSYHDAVLDAPCEVGSFVDVMVTGVDVEGRLVARHRSESSPAGR